MSKIKNSGLDQYGNEPFEQQQFGTAGVEGVNRRPYTPNGLSHNYNSNTDGAFSFGAVAQGIWGQKSPSWAQGRGSGASEAEAVCRNCLQILTAETIKILKFRTIHP